MVKVSVQQISPFDESFQCTPLGATVAVAG
jgi:hypothetical protein